MNPRKMPKRFSRASPTIGGTGPLSEAGTVYIYGVMLQPWSFPTVATAGFASSWMANWLLCIPVAAQREALTVQVILFCVVILYFAHLFYAVQKYTFPVITDKTVNQHEKQL